MQSSQNAERVLHHSLQTTWREKSTTSSPALWMSFWTLYFPCIVWTSV